jgi:hypothetical protein
VGTGGQERLERPSWPCRFRPQPYIVPRSSTRRQWYRPVHA